MSTHVPISMLMLSNTKWMIIKGNWLRFNKLNMSEVKGFRGRKKQVGT
jgi:hypothetical protein